MKKIIQTSTLMMAFGLSLFMFAPNNAVAQDSDCPPAEWQNGNIYNMKNKWFGGCKPKCGHICETDGEGGIVFPDIT